MVAQRADELFYDGPDGEALASADERDLTIAFKSGSEDAYSVIYGRYRPRVESVCRRMLGNPHDAQEATQEAFLRVFQSLHSFNGRYQLGAWITRIATNVCLDNLRAQARRPSQPTPMEEMELTLPDKAVDSDPEFFVIRRAESRRVRRVLESLPPMHRAAIILRDFEGLSYSEVAIALGITDAQVKALLHRARAGFKRAWNPAAVASMFLPARFVDRFRKVEHNITGANNAARTATPIADMAAGASQAAASCGGFIQQCGVVVSERFATAAAAVVVTAGAVAGVGVPASSSQDTPPTRLASTSVATEVPQNPGRQDRPSREHEGASTDIPAVVPTPDPTPSPPEPTPTPSPTPTDPPPGGGENPEPPPVAPVPDDPIVGFDRGGTQIAPLAPISNVTTVSCSKMVVTQRMETMIRDGESQYPAEFVLDSNGGFGIELIVSKDGKTFHYHGGGPLQSLTREGAKATMAYTGYYSTGSEGAVDAGLPQGGRFDVNLSVDCSFKMILTERVVFAAF